MKQKELLVYWLLLMFLLFNFGCAITPKELSPEIKNNTRKIAIGTLLKNEELKILDHTGVMKKTYGGYMYGAVGGLLEGIILSIESHVKIRSSLGGDPDVLRDEVGELDIKKILDEKLVNRFSKAYEVMELNLLEGDMLENDKNKNKLYISKCKENQSDVLILVNFVYGLAAYENAHASAAIDAEISIFDVNTEKILMKKNIPSDILFRESHTIDEFSSNDAELFLKNIDEAANSLSTLIAYEFGIDTDAVEEDREHTVAAIAVTCNKPYPLEQDCSIWKGAKRTVEINDQKIKIAGSTDGKIILVMATSEDRKKLKGATFSNRVRLRRELTKKCLDVVQAELHKHNINTLKIVKMISSNGSFDGYFIELDADGYSILKEFSIKK